jgi:WD40 repeat protein
VADVPTSSAIEEILCESSISMVLACCSKITNKTYSINRRIDPARCGAGFPAGPSTRDLQWTALSVRVRPMQTSLIQNAHGDLVTDAAYDFYGVRLATCSLDHRIKIWQLDESDGTWTAVADWKVRVPFALSRDISL